jgi:nitrite reductase (NO-forming)
LTLAVASHGALLLRAAWGARAGRFAVTVRFYWLAVACVISGIAAGTALEVGVPADWHARVFAVHVHVNLFGWVALTVLGTEFTFWPMVLHTRIAETFAHAARQALRLCTGGIALLVAGLLTAGRVAAVIGLLLYILGVARSLDPFVRAAVQRRPHSAAAWMLAAANGWLVACLVTDALLVATASDAGRLADRTAGLVPWLLTGFVVQVLTGALTYLLPVVVGRGPAGGRRAGGVLDRAGAPRIVAFNTGVALIALPLGTAATDVGWCLVGASVAAFVGLAAGTLFVTRRAPRVEPVG